MSESVQGSTSAQPGVTTATAESVPGSLFQVLDTPAAAPLVPVAQAQPLLSATGDLTRLQILDHPDVAPLAAKIAGTWGDLTGLKSSLDAVKFGSDSEAQIERFFATMNAQAGKMEAHVFLEVANALMEGAEKQDSDLAKIEKEAQEQFRRPFLVKAIALISEGWAKKMERKRLPQITALVQSQFKSGGDRINAWIDGVKTKTEDACRGQIEGIKRWEIAIDEGKKHEILLAATMSAGYQVLDAATAAVPGIPEMNRREQLDKIDVLKQRLVFLGNLYADSPGRMVRSGIGLKAAVTSLTTVMSNAMSFFIQLRESAFDLTQGYMTRALQQGNAELGNTAAALKRRSAQVLGEVAVAAVGMAADSAKQQAELSKTLAGMTKSMVENLKAAESAAKDQLTAASKELAEGQRLMLELRQQQNMG